MRSAARIKHSLATGRARSRRAAPPGNGRAPRDRRIRTRTGACTSTMRRPVEPPRPLRRESRRGTRASSASSRTMNGTRPADRRRRRSCDRARPAECASHASVGAAAVEPQAAALLHRQHDGVRRERARRVTLRRSRNRDSSACQIEHVTRSRATSRNHAGRARAQMTAASDRRLTRGSHSATRQRRPPR